MLPCSRDYHRFFWSSEAIRVTGFAKPPGLLCQCGAFVFNSHGEPIAVAMRGEDPATPTGRCPHCNYPWDDHPRDHPRPGWAARM